MIFYVSDALLFRSADMSRKVLVLKNSNLSDILTVSIGLNHFLANSQFGVLLMWKVDDIIIDCINTCIPTFPPSLQGGQPTKVQHKFLVIESPLLLLPPSHSLTSLGSFHYRMERFVTRPLLFCHWWFETFFSQQSYRCPAVSCSIVSMGLPESEQSLHLSRSQGIQIQMFALHFLSISMLCRLFGLYRSFSEQNLHGQGFCTNWTLMSMSDKALHIYIYS